MFSNIKFSFKVVLVAAATLTAVTATAVAWSDLGLPMWTWKSEHNALAGEVKQHRVDYLRDKSLQLRKLLYLNRHAQEQYRRERTGVPLWLLREQAEIEQRIIRVNALLSRPNT